MSRPNSEGRPLEQGAALNTNGPAKDLDVDSNSGHSRMVEFDATHAIGFLDHAFGDVYSGLLSVCHLKSDGGMAYAQHQWIRDAVAKAEEWDKLRPPGIYFRATMLTPNFKGKRGGADDAHALPFLWADLDYAP